MLGARRLSTAVRVVRGAAASFLARSGYLVPVVRAAAGPWRGAGGPSRTPCNDDVMGRKMLRRPRRIGTRIGRASEQIG